MNARRAGTAASLVLAVAVGITGCATTYEVPIETPISATLDVTPFSRVLVAGFIGAGVDDVDGNLETVRLLRSQLRTKGKLRVIDTDALPLRAVARESGVEEPAQDEPKPEGAPAASPDAERPLRSEKDLEPFERVFANVDYWKRIGEEYQQPLIVTGTVLFTAQSRSGFVQREQEVFDSLGRRRVVPVRTYQERKGFVLRPTFVFIDGRTGATLHTETFREEALYNESQSTPALSSYFELMDRLLPAVLNALSTQKVRGTRVLLK